MYRMIGKFALTLSPLFIQIVNIAHLTCPCIFFGCLKPRFLPNWQLRWRVTTRLTFQSASVFCKSTKCSEHERGHECVQQRQQQHSRFQSENEGERDEFWGTSQANTKLNRLSFLTNNNTHSRCVLTSLTLSPLPFLKFIATDCEREREHFKTQVQTRPHHIRARALIHDIISHPIECYLLACFDYQLADKLLLVVWCKQV